MAQSIGPKAKKMYYVSLAIGDASGNGEMILGLIDFPQESTIAGDRLRMKLSAFLLLYQVFC